MKNKMGWAGLVLAVVLVMGCRAHLEPGGAYAPVVTNLDGTITPSARANIEFFAVEASFKLAYVTADTAFEFERDNRLFLWRISPEIKHGLDGLRPQAVEVKRRYALARQAYEANPVPANLTVMQTILEEAKALAAAAAAALPVNGDPRALKP